MIEEHNEDILNVTRGVIVHGCNAQGVMGSGVAGAIRDAYPEAYEDYREACENGFAGLGDFVPVTIRPYELYIVNAITQNGYGTDRRHVNYGAVAQCFTDLERYRRAGYFGETANARLPVCFPKIGAGLGGGDWEVISEIIDFVVTGEKRLYVI